MTMTSAQAPADRSGSSIQNLRFVLLLVDVPVSSCLLFKAIIAKFCVILPQLFSVSSIIFLFLVSSVRLFYFVAESFRNYLSAKSESASILFQSFLLWVTLN